MTDKPRPDFTLLDLLRERKEIEPRPSDTPPPYQAEGYYRTQELAEMFDVTVGTIRKWLRKERRKGNEIPSKKVYFLALDDKMRHGTAYKLEAPSEDEASM